MSGDLSITPQRSGRDLAAAAGVTRAPVARPSAPDGVGVAALSPQQGVAADASQQIEAAHLRTLLTDPAMRVSTHHDDDSDRVVLRVQSLSTGEVVEQIPSEELLRLYATLRQSLVDERA
jgi:hypothetical protein